jgi:hypothetical protein
MQKAKYLQRFSHETREREGESHTGQKVDEPRDKLDYVAVCLRSQHPYIVVCLLKLHTFKSLINFYLFSPNICRVNNVGTTIFSYGSFVCWDLSGNIYKLKSIQKTKEIRLKKAGGVYVHIKEKSFIEHRIHTKIDE